MNKLVSADIRILLPFSPPLMVAKTEGNVAPPVTFSTITLVSGCSLARPSASMRPITSVEPPGGKGTMMLTVFSGQSAAWAGAPSTADIITRSGRENRLELFLETCRVYCLHDYSYEVT